MDSVDSIVYNVLQWALCLWLIYSCHPFGSVPAGTTEHLKRFKTHFIFTGSEARTDREWVQRLYPDISGTNYNSLQQATLGTWAEIIIKSRTGNVLQLDILTEIAGLNSFIKNISALTENSTRIKYDYICARTILGCSIDGDIFFTNAFLRALENETIAYPLFTFTFGTHYIGSKLGGHKVIEGEGKTRYIRSAEFMKLKYPLRTDGEEYVEMAETWLAEFASKLDGFTSNLIDITFAHSNSLDEELDKNIKGDITLFSITITLMITYSCIATMSAR